MGSEHVILVGLSGSGKTTVGRLLADALHRPFVDTDEAIVAAAGRPIPAIFADDGEARFRELEAAAVRQALDGPPAVISLGGGAILHPTTRILCAGQRLLWLDAPPELLARRVAPGGTARGRPLLAGEAPERRLAALLAQRRRYYAQAHVRLDATAAPADVVRSALTALDRHAAPAIERLPIHTSAGAAPSTYDVVSGRGILARVAELAAERLGPGSRRAFIVSDTNVWPIAGALLEHALCDAGWQMAVHVVPAGEQTKALAAADSLWTWLAEQGAERRDPIVAFGGGVVGDLAGFVAATYLRGVPFIQIPTTLLAQVDSSIGGKVAVDHPLAKNMIGAFKAPDLVVVDTALLTSLEADQVAAGWAEVLKHGVILDRELFDLMEAEAGHLSDLAPDLTLLSIRRSLAIKARVVEEDEFERGPRMLLNYGHTLGHAIEAATGYGRYLHGQAVALGMVAAAWMAVRLGLLPEADFQRIDATLARLGLPVRATGLDEAMVLAAMRRDKKVRQGQITWVLPRRIGEAFRTTAVPPELPAQALAHLASADPTPLSTAATART